MTDEPPDISPTSDPDHEPAAPQGSGTLAGLVRNLGVMPSIAGALEARLKLAESLQGFKAYDSTLAIPTRQELKFPPNPLIAQGEDLLEATRNMHHGLEAMAAILDATGQEIAAMATLAQAQLKESADLRAVIEVGQVQADRRDRSITRLTTWLVVLSAALLLFTGVVTVFTVLLFLR